MLFLINGVTHDHPDEDEPHRWQPDCLMRNERTRLIEELQIGLDELTLDVRTTNQHTYVLMGTPARFLPDGTLYRSRYNPCSTY